MTLSAAAEPGAEDAYAPPPFEIPHASLWIDLQRDVARVRAELRFRRARVGVTDLVLDGVGLRLAEARLDGQVLADDRLTHSSHGLVLAAAPDEGVLALDYELTVGSAGQEGLIRLGEALITHCEPEGFRRICYFPDRPDVMTAFRCTLAADPEAFPDLLCNGALVEAGELPDGRRYAVWDDPRPKASYLFALAAGRFDKLEDRFVTRSGRGVRLGIHARSQDLPWCRHGLAILKQAMAWDERAYGREYDLDDLNVVVLPSYPGGAMENRGLNLYATEFFLADPAISTDEQMRRVSAVIGHEYFHNWTGNRVGCRSWLDLGLKEGFTVLRQQQFMADLAGADEARIDDVIQLREVQFPEDDGPLAHAPRPAAAAVPSNLYSRTIYDKSAEIIRMLATLAGPAASRRISDAFFARLDGRAAAFETLFDIAEEVAGLDLAQFRRWIRAVGGFHVTAAWTWDPASKRFSLTLEQSVRTVTDHPNPGPLLAPVRVGMVGPGGQALAFRSADQSGPLATEQVLELREGRQTFVLEGLAAPPVPSLFRGLSSPVRLTTALDPGELAILARYDGDPTNRWDAAQTLARRAVSERLRLGPGGHIQLVWRDLFDDLLAQAAEAPGAVGRALTPPDDRALGLELSDADPEALAQAQHALAAEMTPRVRDRLRAVHARLAGAAVTDEGVGARRLRAVCLWQLMQAPEPQDLARCRSQLDSPRMAEACAALSQLVACDAEAAKAALAVAFERWRAVPQALDQWFAIQATVGPQAADRVEALIGHSDYRLDNATRVKAVFDAFVLNMRGFHRADGAGYRIVARIVVALNPGNPRLAARFLKAFGDCERFDAARRAHANEALIGILAQPGLAKPVESLARDLLSAGSLAV
ncbi:aminopeptidase N [Phenylobacterium sp.]|uniref:aminopeptidase N n=1 Tax=Phenylobacterium sp. TaxID=1871053 RepID=UPI003563A201